MTYEFNGYRLDTEDFTLVGPDGPIHLEPQVFDLLRVLIDNRDRVVTKLELFDAVWQDRFVSESALSSRVKTLRSALGDSGRAQHSIRTAHGRGYQFVAAVELGTTAAGQPPVGGALEADGVPRAAAALPPITDELRGRDDDLAELGARVRNERLVTLLGPGGTGKTRLSTELARRVPADRLVAFVDLAAVRSGDAVRDALALALGVQTGQNANLFEACCAYLRPRDALLIVDNCEHLVGDAAALVGEILAATDATTVLATSRVPLGVRGEMLFRLSPLPVMIDNDQMTAEQAARNSAVSLFVDRARRADRSFALSDDNCHAVVDLCRALDGLPLALELAAGRLGVLGLDDLATRLDRRLDLLASQGADGQGRHRSLRAMLDWSHELLDDECQRMLRFLSVFPAGVTLETAEWLGARVGLTRDPLQVLTMLVEASLLTRTDAPSGSRYGQLETMRTFGLDQLDAHGELDAAHELAAQFTLRFTQEVDAGFRTPDEARFDDLVRQELPNLRAGRTRLWTAERWTDLVDVSANLLGWCHLRDVSELFAWIDELDELIPLLGVPDQARIHAMSALGAWRRGRIEDTIRRCETALDLDDDEWCTTRALNALATAWLFSGRLDRATADWRRRYDLDGFVMDLANSSLARAYAGDHERALDGARQALTEADAGDWPQEIAWTHYIVGEILAHAGDPDARSHLETAVALADEIGSSFTFGVASVTLATDLVARGETGAAAALFAELIEHWLRSGTWTQLWTTLRHAARLLAGTDPDHVVRVLVTAARDPYSPSLDDAAEAAQSDLLTTLGHNEAVSATGAPDPAVERGQLAEATRRKLLELAV